MKFSYKLIFKKRCVAAGIKNAHLLSIALGGSDATGSKWWHGNAKTVQTKTMSKLCGILGVTPGRLFIPSDEEEPEVDKHRVKPVDLRVPADNYPEYRFDFTKLAKVRGLAHPYDLYKRLDSVKRRQTVASGLPETGASKEAAGKLWRGESLMFPITLIGELCETLQCKPEKLFTLEYEQEDEEEDDYELEEEEDEEAEEE